MRKLDGDSGYDIDQRGRFADQVVLADPPRPRGVPSFVREPSPSSSDRRVERRTDTAFYAVELRDHDLRYRLIRNISESGFFIAEPAAAERPGDRLVVEFPLPGARDALRVDGEVAYVGASGVGVRIVRVDRERYAHLLAYPPPPRARG